MKLRLRNRQVTDTAYNVINGKEEVVGLAEESFNRTYWLLTMNDSPASTRFEKLSDVTKYVYTLKL
jgi:hypothetical protein